ncbi:MAG: phosphate ABC transporter permease PstA [Candidatus Eisenbacteria bacterium]|uniref:Phosphate transport system permease protein PstA n=1 Tax=Eiseniibacteriota bacterium TaxID=2212470 RepID=A0A948RY80_UNCEI|nr:phosphate ABC transporter permease PstA [Candidatus Eisenbacteria bacterium]MBU1951076.1 phosphate ABC transporter permease PstA [Candidatus Eisenbacteria bacterium]MBU2693213.1 phosphate ABC transporter permease PstA [Candidatus Eisenbacteria bacterium]
MRIGTRKLIDRSFSGLGFFSVALMGLAVLVILAPIITRGLGAFVFKGTVEFRRMQLENFERGHREAIEKEILQAAAARKPVYAMIETFKSEIDSMKINEKLRYRKQLKEVEGDIAVLLGPKPGDPRRVLPRQQYGQTRWDRAQVKLRQVIFRTEYDYSDTASMGTEVFVPRANDFAGTALAGLFPYLEEHIEEMLAPRITFYPRFLSDISIDSHLFGGIRAEVLGTLFLAIGAMFFALPMGVLSAVYLVEYSREGRIISLLRTCVSTLAGVPSIVFALFGLAFFINTMKVTESKSVLAGSLTLACLILPTVIRASEEALRAVPNTYREASMSLGAGKWRTIVTVVLPAAIPGILTGTVISLGRAAGETAPIIFTAAVSVGEPLNLFKAKFWEVLSQPTPALPWNIYNLCTEHEAVDEIRHVQYGMVLTLVLLVLVLNTTAIIMRARISRKLKG